MMKILGWIIATPFIALALFVAARYMLCGPNREVVRVAKPVVKIIADDIVKNGIPKSLEDIEGLPYVLEECRRKEVYWKDHDKVKSKDDANWMELFFKCYFKVNKKKYNTNARFARTINKNDWDGTVDIYNKNTYTGIGVYFPNKHNKGFYYDPIGNGYAVHHGILCNDFKQ